MMNEADTQGQMTLAWCAEMAAALRTVEKIAAQGGAYGLAYRAREMASALEVAKTLDDGVKQANAAPLLGEKG